MNNLISEVEGVKNFYTERITPDGTHLQSSGISLLVWNNVYDKEDIFVTTQNILLKYFQFPFLFDKENLLNRIQIITETV